MNKIIKVSDIESNTNDVSYFNISIVNNDVDRKKAIYNQILQVPLLNNPNEYFLSIVRFSIPGQGIPIFFFRENKYHVVLRYGGVDFQTPVIYSPNINPLLNDNTIYSYNSFITMINTALLTSFNALKVAFPGAPPTEAPYMQYNAQTLLCSLYCQQSYDPVVAGAPTIEIYFNNILYYFFDNFFIIRTGNQDPSYKDYKFVITNQRNNAITSDINNPAITGGNPYYKFEQEYSTTYNWNDTKTISFKSGLFPVASEYVRTGQNQTVASEKILTDFEPIQSLSDPSGFRGVLQYQAQGVYRLIDIASQNPLKSIDLQITYKDELGDDHDLYIPHGSSITVKIAFIKKSLYKSTYAH